MSQVTIRVGDDELGTGEESVNGTDQFDRRHPLAVNVNECDLIGEDFREFERHLVRLLGGYGWTYRENRTGRHQRTYYFDRSVTLEPVVSVPEEPSGVAALVGKDPYTTPGDINFLLKGDRFRAERSRPFGRKEVVYGTAAMDGNAISPDHGWLIFESNGSERTAEAKRRAYEPKEGAYINVHFDHREPGYYDAAVAANRQGYGYKPAGPGWPNEGLNLRDGWQIWVLPEVANRKDKALRDARKARATSEAEKRLAKAEQALKDAKAAVALAEKNLRDLK